MFWEVRKLRLELVGVHLRHTAQSSWSVGASPRAVLAAALGQSSLFLLARSCEFGQYGYNSHDGWRPKVCSVYVAELKDKLSRYMDLRKMVKKWSSMTATFA